jgi:O-antigen/teichoic acid export membrane protein
VAPALIDVSVGRQWQASILPTRILAFFSLAYCLSFFFGHVVTALGRPTVRLAVVVAQALCQAATTLVGVRWGIPGVAAAVVATQVLFYAVELAVLRRLVRFSMLEFLYPAVVPGVAAAAMAVVVLLVQGALAGTSPALALVAGVAAGMAVYGGIVLLLARPRLRELAELVRRLRG